jgi:alanyl-tRNA synthetase
MPPLYQEDPYQKEFDATIVEMVENEKHIAVVLSQTAFYPEGGGQLSDQGFLNEIPVLEVKVEKGKIFHFIDKKNKAKLTIGQKIGGKIDWQRRFDHMQHHTGQHLLSATFQNEMGGETFSVHFGDDISWIDVSIDNLDWSTALKVENHANAILFENRSVKTHLVETKDELLLFPLRGLVKAQDNIRVVEIQNYDYCACGGTHVRFTGEIGLIKLRKWQKIKNGLRIEYYCGQKALNDYQHKNIAINEISTLLKSNDMDIQVAVDRILKETEECTKKNQRLTELLNNFEIQALKNSGETVNGIFIVSKIFEERSQPELRDIAVQAVKLTKHIVLLGAKLPKSVIILTRSQDCDLNLNEILKNAILPLGGKGGGKPDMVQAAIGGENLEIALQRALDQIKNAIV